MKKKVKLNSIKIESFITEVNSEEGKTVNGGKKNTDHKHTDTWPCCWE